MGKSQPSRPILSQDGYSCTDRKGRSLTESEQEWLQARLTGWGHTIPRREDIHSDAAQGNATYVDQEARGLVAELAMSEAEGIRGLPRIEWARLRDEENEEMDGYWFKPDKRSTCLQKGEDWVLGRSGGDTRGSVYEYGEAWAT